MRKFACVLLFLAQVALGGTTGKIAGRVTDRSNGEPVPGANIVIVGTQLGATSDIKGNYFIINVPVGTYTVRVSQVGYTAHAVSDVKVTIDMTTTIDFGLSSREIQADEVLVSASRPAIQQDLTSTKHTIDADMISALPVDGFQEVVQVQAGVNGSHFRGGRFNESLFLVDGVQVKSPVNGYTGYTGGFAANIPQINVDEVQVSTGGFEAEYGNAQSGVVNTLTRDPKGRFTGRLRARTSDFPWAKIEYRPNDYGTGLPDWKGLEAYLSSPYADLGDAKIAMTGSADVAWQTRGFLSHESLLRQSYQAKILSNFGNTRISVNGLLSLSTWDDYYHRYSKFGPVSRGYQLDHFERGITSGNNAILQRYLFVDNPIGTPAPVLRTVTDSILFDGKKYGQVIDFYQAGMQEHISVPQNDSYNIGLSWTQTLNTHSFLDVKVSEFYNRFHEVVRDVDDRNKNANTTEELYYGDNNSSPYPTSGYMDRQFTESYWYYTGDEGWWFNQVARTYALRADYSNQVSNTNLLKAGGEFNYSMGNVEKVTFESVTTRRYDIWDEDLYDIAVYVQDKIEVRDGFILNAGLRVDYFNPNGFGAPVLFPADATDLSNPARRDNLTPADKVEPRWQVSPRIGIAHPITERDKLHFYYGHFFQRPDFRYLYENVNLDFRFSTNVDVGNPRLAPEKTVSYEVGWEHLFSDFLRLDIVGYYKDITNLVTATDFSVQGATESYQVYENQDYANVRGFEITLESVGPIPISGMINYTYAYANGRSSSVFKGNNEVIPRRLDPLDWDIRHKINANLIFRSYGGIADVIGDAELTFLVTVRSGLPYTSNTRDVFPLFTLRNDGRLPWYKNVDVRLRKTWHTAGIDVSLLGEVLNLFDWRNVSFIAGGREGIQIFEATGDPRGPYQDPTAYTSPRVYRLGAEIQF
jgi:outer membrane receptor for ferrienterochelin and colicin